MRVSFIAASAFLAVAAGFAPPAAAQSRLTVEALREMCASPDPQRKSTCNAYVAGVRHTLDVFKNSLKQRLNYCIPPRVSTLEVRDAFLRWAGANPAAQGQAAVAGIIRTVHEAYPCRKGEPFEF